MRVRVAAAGESNQGIRGWEAGGRARWGVREEFTLAAIPQMRKNHTV